MSDQNDDRFKTHIKEPRWQRAASIVIVAAILLLWAFLLLHH